MLMSAIGPEMTGGVQCIFIFNVRCGYNSRICNCGMLVYNGARCVHIYVICAVKPVHNVYENNTYLACAQCVQK